jgi:hypothetical protein
MYTQRIRHLEEAQHSLRKQVEILEKDGHIDNSKLEQLKKKQLLLTDKLVILRAKQSTHVVQ